MLNAEILRETWDEQLAEKQAVEVVRLVMPDYPDVANMSKEELLTTPPNELELVLSVLTTALLEKTPTPMALLSVGITLGALATNRAALTSEVPDAPPAD